MTVPLTTATENQAIENEEIHREIAAAHHALDRYYDLSTFEYQAQKECLASIEDRLAKLEKAVMDLHCRVDTLCNSRIWRTLMRAGRLIQRFSRRP